MLKDSMNCESSIALSMRLSIFSTRQLITPLRTVFSFTDISLANKHGNSPILFTYSISNWLGRYGIMPIMLYYNLFFGTRIVFYSTYSGRWSTRLPLIQTKNMPSSSSGSISKYHIISLFH